MYLVRSFVDVAVEKWQNTFVAMHNAGLKEILAFNSHTVPVSSPTFFLLHRQKNKKISEALGRVSPKKIRATTGGY